MTELKRSFEPRVDEFRSLRPLFIGLAASVVTIIIGLVWWLK